MNSRRLIAYALIVLAILGWAFFFLAWFLPVGRGLQATISIGSLVFAEVSFLIGSLLLGKEVIQKYRSRLRIRSKTK
jgi:hypothetical protein